MELAYPFVLIIGIIGLVVLIFIKYKRKTDYEDGKKIANTKFVKENPYYREVMKRYKILATSLKTVCAISIIMSLLLISRVGSLNLEEMTKYNRDIILCMDVSDSVNELNRDLVEDLKRIVKKLKGERFGISVFNTSSVTLVPLTDDYEYILNKLDELQNILKTRVDYLDRKIGFEDDSVYSASIYLEAGTLVGNEVRGSSIIGDGLASSINLFGDLKENRTRIVIFTTDNELYGKEIVTLKEAGEICKEKGITVFGISPNTILSKDKLSMKEAIEITGGSHYTEGDKNTISSIIDNIEKKGKNLIKGENEVKIVDKPQIPFIILIISLMGLFILDKKVNI